MGKIQNHSLGSALEKDWSTESLSLTTAIDSFKTELYSENCMSRRPWQVFA